MMLNGIPLRLASAALLGGFGLFSLHSTAAQKFTDWSPPVNLGPVINSGFNETFPVVSKRRLSLYFSSNRPGFGGLDIWVSRRASVGHPWGEPTLLGENVNTAFDEDSAALSRDGHWLFLASNRPGGQGNLDLWVSWRAHTHDDFGWLPAVNLGEVINTAAVDGGSSFFENDDAGIPTLYFGSSRAGGLGLIDIYVSRLAPDSFWGPAQHVSELSSTSQDIRPYIRFDGLEIVLDSNRPGSIANSRDLWFSTRKTVEEAWAAPLNLGPTVNSDSFDGFASLSPDGQTLYFTSNRPGGFGGTDIWMSTRSRRIGRP
jgi:hypothetical protein